MVKQGGGSIRQFNIAYFQYWLSFTFSHVAFLFIVRLCQVSCLVRKLTHFAVTKSTEWYKQSSLTGCCEISEWQHRALGCLGKQFYLCETLLPGAAERAVGRSCRAETRRLRPGRETRPWRPSVQQTWRQGNTPTGNHMKTHRHQNRDLKLMREINNQQ